MWQKRFNIEPLTGSYGNFMFVLVNLHHENISFCLKEEQKRRLIVLFPQHEFHFAQNYEDFKAKIPQADYAIVWSFSEKLYSLAKNLKAIFTPAAGKDWVAKDPQGKVHRHFGSFHGEIIVESFLAMLFYWNNKISNAVDMQSANIWNRNGFEPRRLLKNKKVLIVGYGHIGAICAEKLLSLGISVSGACRDVKKAANCPLYDIKNLADFIGSYDVILNLLPGGAETGKLIDEKLLEKMKDGVAFFNFGRGTTVDEDALIKFLKSGKIGFAGLDVFEEEPLPLESPLWKIPNVLLTPHSSCCYDDYLELFIYELPRVLK